MSIARTASIVVLSAVYAVYCLATQPPGPVTAPDTARYVEMRPIAPIGYPLFLRAVGPQAAITLQPLLFAAALAGLGVALLRASGSLVLSLAVVAGTLATPGLTEIHASLLTESLFMSALAVFVAAVIAFIRQPSLKTVAAAGLVAALALTVRRAAVAWVPVLAAVCVLIERRRGRAGWAALACAVVPALGVYSIDQALAAAVHGKAATSLAGPHLFAKAALLEAPPASPDTDERRRSADRALEVVYAPIRSLIAKAPPDLRSPLTLYYETCLQDPCAALLRASLAPLGESEINQLLAEAGRARIAHSPLAFARLTATHYGSFWKAYKLRHPATASALTAFLAANRPLPFEREAFKVGAADPIVFEGTSIVRLLQPAVLAAGWLTAVVGAAAVIRLLLGRPPDVLTIAGAAALIAHATLLFSALAAAGIARFIVSVSPALVTACCTALWAAAAASAGRAGHGQSAAGSRIAGV